MVKRTPDSFSPNRSNSTISFMGDLQTLKKTSKGTGRPFLFEVLPMKWTQTPRSAKGPVRGGLRRLVGFLSRLEPFFVRTVSTSPVFSDEDREKLVEKFRDIREGCVEGESRLQQTQGLRENFEPDETLYDMDDILLHVRFEKTRNDLQYFVSLGLHIIEKLYITNHISEQRYSTYRRLLKYLPRLHQDLVDRTEGE
jgi:hypothetical protein